MSDTPLDILADELGAITGRIEREVTLRIAAAIADLQRREAEFELLVTTRLASLKDGRDGVDGKDGTDGKDGRDGIDGKDGFNGKDGAAGIDGRDGPQGKDGPQGAQGVAGAPGKLPVVRAWADRIHYEGDVVAHDGATYQAQRDTGRSPSHEDWICLSRAGRDGADGRTPVIKSTYKDGDEYSHLDIVMLNGASFFAKRDNPGQCPGDGWQLMAMQGKQGKPGERGQTGPKGDRGLAGPAVSGLEVDGDGLFRLKNGDGSVVDVDLYPLLAQLSR